MLASFEHLRQMAQNGARACDDFVRLMTERAILEEGYAKGLTKLSDHALGKLETGSMRDAMAKVKGDLANRAEQHRALAASIRQDVIAPIVALTETSDAPYAEVAKTKSLLKDLKSACEKGRKGVKRYNDQYHNAVEAAAVAGTETPAYWSAPLDSDPWCTQEDLVEAARSAKACQTPSSAGRSAKRRAATAAAGSGHLMSGLRVMFGGKGVKPESLRKAARETVASTLQAQEECEMLWAKVAGIKLEFEGSLAKSLTLVSTLEHDRLEETQDCLRRYVIFQSSLYANSQYDVQVLSTDMDGVDVPTAEQISKPPAVTVAGTPVSFSPPSAIVAVNPAVPKPQPAPELPASPSVARLPPPGPIEHCVYLLFARPEVDLRRTSVSEAAELFAMSATPASSPIVMLSTAAVAASPPPHPPPPPPPSPPVAATAAAAASNADAEEEEEDFKKKEEGESGSGEGEDKGGDEKTESADDDKDEDEDMEAQEADGVDGKAAAAPTAATPSNPLPSPPSTPTRATSAANSASTPTITPSGSPSQPGRLLAEVRKLIRTSPDGLPRFTRALDGRRAKGVLLKQTAFDILGALLLVALDVADQRGDFVRARTLMVVSQTFYRVEKRPRSPSTGGLLRKPVPPPRSTSSPRGPSASAGAGSGAGAGAGAGPDAGAFSDGSDDGDNTPEPIGTQRVDDELHIHLQSKVLAHRIWQNMRYWESVVFDSLGAEMNKIAAETTIEKEDQEIDVTTTQLGFFAFQMISFGLPADSVKTLLHKYAQFIKLSDAEYEALLARVQDFLDEREERRGVIVEPIVDK